METERLWHLEEESAWCPFPHAPGSNTLAAENCDGGLAGVEVNPCGSRPLPHWDCRKFGVRRGSQLSLSP
jgi:hypothetical protein